MARHNKLTRRAALTSLAVAGGAGLANTLRTRDHPMTADTNHSSTASPDEKRPRQNTLRQPAIFVPHGGGPWPFVDLGHFVSQKDVATMRAYFEALPQTLPAPPQALLVISA